MRSDTAEFDIAHSQSEEVGRDGLLHDEVVVSVGRFFCGVDGTHQGHQLGGYFHMGFVSETNAGAVLTGHPGSGEDGLALGEQEWRLALNPEKGRGIRGGGVRHADFLGAARHRDAQRLSQEGAHRSQFERSVLAVHCHVVNGEVAAIEQQARCVFRRLDLVGGCGGDLTLVKINLGVPLQMRGDGFVWLAEAVVVGGAFHVGDELGFLGGSHFRCRTTDGNQKQTTRKGFEHVHGCDLVRQGSASVTNPQGQACVL